MKNKAAKRISMVLAAMISVSLLLGTIPGNFLYKNVFAEFIQNKADNGSTLYNIAKKFGIKISSLGIDNKNPLNSTKPGQVSPVSGNIPLKADQYRVAANDTLNSIAIKYKTTATELKWANNLTSDNIYPGQVITIPAKQTKPLKDILSEKGIDTSKADIKMFADKSDHLIGIVSQNQLLKTYHMELGDSGLGDKQIEGDHKTPEGTLYIAEKSVLSPEDQYLGTRWMRLSYPSIEDADRGLKQGLIDQYTHDSIVNAINNKQVPPQDTALGGGVGVHGGSTIQLGSDWTWGCLGLTNNDVEDFYDFVKVGTPVIIEY